MRSALLALFVALVLWAAPPAQASRDNAPKGAATYEERTEAEKVSRSRYRRLEIASLVLILVCGGAAILWAMRRK